MGGNLINNLILFIFNVTFSFLIDCAKLCNLAYLENDKIQE